MNEVLDYISLGSLEAPELLVRMLLAMLFGLVVGWERDRKNKPIDYKVYMIVCTMTCVLGILAQEISLQNGPEEEFLTLDLGKIISGVLTGIGFLGAGAIIKGEGKEVIGTATGASIWASGCIGLAIGFGIYGLALTGFLVIIAILLFGRLGVSFLNTVNEKKNDL